MVGLTISSMFPANQVTVAKMSPLIVCNIFFLSLHNSLLTTPDCINRFQQRVVTVRYIHHFLLNLKCVKAS